MSVVKPWWWQRRRKRGFAPTEIADLLAWIDFAGEPDGAYASATDELGNSTTTTAAPTITSGVASFTAASNEYVDTGILASALDEFTFFARVNPGAASDAVMGATAAVPRLYCQANTFSYNSINTVTWTGTTGWQTLIYVRGPSDVYVRRDGAEVGRTAEAKTTLLGIATRYGQAGGSYLNGDMITAGIYDRALVGGELERLEAWLDTL